MSMSRKMAWLGGVGMLAAAMAFTGPTGCSDSDDDDDAPAGGTTVVVVTNQADGTVVTNIVEVPVVPAEANILNVAGDWNGPFQTDVGEGHIDLQLLQQEETVIGQCRVDTGMVVVGNVAGSIDGDHLTLMLTLDSGSWIELDGNVNAAATAYIGNLTGDYGQGQFTLQK